MLNSMFGLWSCQFHRSSFLVQLSKRDLRVNHLTIDMAYGTRRYSVFPDILTCDHLLLLPLDLQCRLFLCQLVLLLLAL